MEKTVQIKDGTDVVIRPMTMEDLDRSVEFFKRLPEGDRVFLRYDVTKPERLEERIAEMDRGLVKRLVAVREDRIIADGALELIREGWKKHMGELRLVVSRAYQRKGLGALMARELYGLAASEKLEEIVVRMMRPQEAARSIFGRLGFKEDAVLPGYVRDRHGQRQDLVVMRCNLEELWRTMEHYLDDTDWRRAR